jgi:hypothetical protein
VSCLITRLIAAQVSPLGEESNKNLKENFLTLRDQLGDQQDDLENNETYEEAIVVRDVLLNTSAAIRGLHSSGSVIFSGDAVDYLNKLKDYLLKDYEGYRAKINVYITREPTHNAFSIVTGNIYINTGLLKNLKNEAQLAYILCHEIMHIVNKHSINEQLKSKGIKDAYDGLEIISDETSGILKSHSVNKLNEFQADIDGLKLYSLTDYPYTEALKVIESLNDYAFLNGNLLPEKELFFAEDAATYVKILSPEQQLLRKEGTPPDNNTGSTHPSISERYAVLEHIVKDQQDSLRKRCYIIAEPDFFVELQHASGEDCIHEYLKAGVIAPVIVHSFDALRNRRADRRTLQILCYSLSICLYKKNEKQEIDNGYAGSGVEKLMKSYINGMTKTEFQKFYAKILDTLSVRFPDNTELFAQYKQLLITTPDTSQKTLDDVRFKLFIGNASQLTGKQERNYHQFERYEELDGKVATIAVFNIAILLKTRTCSPLYSEKLDLQVTKALQQLSEHRPNELINLIPGKFDYTSETYSDYQLTNNWLVERFGFENSNYISLYQRDIDSFISRTGVRYIMVGENFELKAISGKLFLKAFYGAIPVPIYIPQMVFKLFVNQKRKYMLNLIFNLQTKELVFWDRRTYLEPNSVAQLFQNYNDILDEVSKK